jgi:hypothetical protein
MAITREQRDAERHLANVNRRIRHLAAQLDGSSIDSAAPVTTDGLRNELARMEERRTALTQRLAVLAQEGDAETQRAEVAK